MLTLGGERDCVFPNDPLLLELLFCFTIDQYMLKLRLFVFAVELALQAEHEDAPLAGGAQELLLCRVPRHGANEWSVSWMRPRGDADAAGDRQGNLRDGL